MEIKDYVIAIRRRFMLVVALPLLAIVATAGLLLLQSARFQATAVVVVPALSAKGYSTSAVTQYFSTYKDVLTSKPIIDQLSKQTGLTSAQLVPNLSATTVSASSNIVNVTFIGANKAQAPKVAALAAHLSLDALVAPQLSLAQAALVTAQGEQSAASDALAQFTKQTGLLSPDVDYRLKVAELSQLTVQLEQARIAADAARVNALGPLITQRQQALTTLSAQLLAYQQINDGYKAAVASVTHAQQQVDGVKALITSNGSPSAVTATPANIEKTTICRISLFAIASMIERGTTWVTNSLRLSAETLRLVAVPVSGSGRLRFSPGRSRLTMTRPSASETKLTMPNAAANSP